MTPAEQLQRLTDEAHALLMQTGGTVKEYLHEACRFLSLARIAADKQAERGADGEGEE